MFRYVDKNTQTIVESPFRFDLRLKEHRHLKLYVGSGEHSPKHFKKGFSLADIAAEWGISYRTLQRRRSVLLPKPDGMWNSCLVWNKMPESPFLKVNAPGFTTRDIANHYGKSTYTIRNLVKRKKIVGPDKFRRNKVGRPSPVWMEIPYYNFRRKPQIITLSDLKTT